MEGKRHCFSLSRCRAVTRESFRKYILLFFFGLGGLVTGVSEGRATNYATINFAAGYTNGNLVGQNGWGQVGTSNTNQPIQITNGVVSIKGANTLPQSAYINFTSSLGVINNTEAKTYYYILQNFVVKDAYLTTNALTGSGVAAFSTITNGNGSNFARLFIRRAGAVLTSTNYNLGISSSGQTAVYGSTALIKDTSYNVVVAYTAKAGELGESAVFVNPVGQNPGSWVPVVSQTNTNQPSYNFKSFVLQQGFVGSANAKNYLTAGRILIGDTPQDVTRYIDSDGDGVFDSREIADGTNPNDPSSYNNLNKGLVAYYPFNGNGNDDSGNDNTSIINGAQLTSDRIGNNNNALYINSNNGGATSSATIQISGNASRTISFWTKFSDNAVRGGPYTQTTVSWGDYSRTGSMFLLSEESNGNIWFAGHYADLYNDTPNNLPSFDQWRMITLTYSGSLGSAKEYINGIEQAQSSITLGAHNLVGMDGSLNTVATPLYMSGLTGNYIDDVRVYNRALSLYEIGQLYEREAGNLDSDGDGLTDARRGDMGDIRSFRAICRGIRRRVKRF
jgi:hypothetical protein